MGLILAGTTWGGRLASLDVIDLVFQAGWLVQLVLLVLALLSVVSWAVIAFKWRELRRASQDSEAFLRAYREGSLDAAAEAARKHRASPLAAVFASVYAELHRIARYAGQPAGRVLDEAKLGVLLQQAAWAGASEALRLERGLAFLATTGNTSPFIGLFGTVIGIIGAFQGIGQHGSASLAVVAPGIAEALIATAFGLAAAIPASAFYNHFVGQLRGVELEIDLFREELGADLRRLARGAPAAARGAAKPA